MAKVPHRLPHPVALAEAPHARHDRLFVHVQSTDAAIQRFHRPDSLLPYADGGYRAGSDSASRAPVGAGATLLGAKRHPGETVPRASRTKVTSTSCTAASGPTPIPYLTTDFHSSRAKPRLHDGCPLFFCGFQPKTPGGIKRPRRDLNPRPRRQPCSTQVAETPANFVDNTARPPQTARPVISRNVPKRPVKTGTVPVPGDQPPKIVDPTVDGGAPLSRWRRRGDVRRVPCPLARVGGEWDPPVEWQAGGRA